MKYEPVIGLEVHAQLLTASKAFCPCTTKFGNIPNSNTCPICLGMPGVLPVLNGAALEYTVKMALACHCSINEVSRFARKNYYYPDLPKNYQISQYELPVAEHGWVEIETADGSKRIGLTRIHMEEDAGKLIHDETKAYSYVDLNRTGVPLMEIVSEPDIRSPEEASAYLKALHAILVYLEICDGNMEEGSFRCDANISIRPLGAQTLGVKTELKNMNSFRNVQRALQYEIDRQEDVIASGGVIVQETRLFDPGSGTTSAMRSKEQAHDYRYFPDPDLLPLRVPAELIERVAGELPELPGEKRDRFVSEYGIPRYDAEVLTSSRLVADYFEATAGLFRNPKMVSNWVMTELLRLMKSTNETDPSARVSAQMLADLLAMIDQKIVSGKMAKAIFEEMYQYRQGAKEIVEARSLMQVSDEDELRALVRKLLEESPLEVARYHGGKTQLLGHFVGRIMKATKGKANPGIVNNVLREELEKLAPS